MNPTHWWKEWRQERGDQSNSCWVKCHQGGWCSWGLKKGYAFSSTTMFRVHRREVRTSMASGRLLRSLLEPILFVTAGGNGEHWRPVDETEEINGAAGDHLPARHDTHIRIALRVLSCSLYRSLTHSFPFISTLYLTVCLSSCCPKTASLWPFPSTYWAIVCAENLLPSLNVQLVREVSIMDNNCWASYYRTIMQS